MLVQRVAYGALAIAIIFAIVLLDIVIAQRGGELSSPWGDLLRHGSIVPLAIATMLALGAWELRRLLHQKNCRPYTRFALVMIVALALAPWLSSAGWLGRSAAQLEGLYWTIVLLVLSVIGAGCITVFRGDPTESLRDFGGTLIMVFYIGFLGSFGTQLRCGRDLPGDNGAWLLLIVVLVTKASDIGAFFSGVTFGRHKLAPTISPGKTVEGGIGGLIGSTAVAMLIAWCGTADVAHQPTVSIDAAAAAAPYLSGMLADAVRGFVMEYKVDGLSPVIRAAFLGFLLSVFGQIGDLFESCFKRDAHLKDSGAIMPRFGGILDLIDSPIVAMPIAWVVLTGIWTIV